MLSMNKCSLVRGLRAGQQRHSEQALLLTQHATFLELSAASLHDL